MFSRLRSFLTAWTWRARFEDALDEEVRFHLDAHAEDLVRSGVPIQEAKQRARVRFGSVEGMKDPLPAGARAAARRRVPSGSAIRDS